MIYYSSPYKKGAIGEAMDAFIEHLPDNATICLTDADAMFLHPNYGSIVKQLWEDNKQEYSLIGAMTNRVGVDHHLPNGEFSNDFDIRNHIPKAQAAYDMNGLSVKPVDVVAGFFMLFSKDTWERAGGFGDMHRTWDRKFSKAVSKFGKLGVAEGLYLFHQYRPHHTLQRKAQADTRHLG